MIYFVCFSYEPNTATYNRMLAYWQNLDKMKIPVKLVFFVPSPNRSKIAYPFSTVEVEYCWDKYYINNRYFKYLSFLLYQYRFLKKLKAGDKVCIFGLEKISKKVLEKDGVELFLESTECPEVYKSLSWNNPTVPEYIDYSRKATALFVISSTLKDYYISKGVDEAKIFILNMTVDTERFQNLHKRPSKDKYIAYCGNVSNSKDGVDKLIKSFAIVVKRHPEIKLYLIGDKPSGNESSGNYRLIEELGIKSNVVFTGRVLAADMPQILKNAELLTLARPDNKQAKYGFPTKLGEYLMTENPVVVTSVGDIPKFLKDGVSALIASPNDDNEFAEKMIWALDHPVESREIGMRGKEVALQSFNAAIETKKLVDVVLHN